MILKPRIVTHGTYLCIKAGFLNLTFPNRVVPLFKIFAYAYYSKFLWMNTTPPAPTVFSGWSLNLLGLSPMVCSSVWKLEFVFILFLQSYAPFSNICLCIYSKFLWTQLLLKFSVVCLETVYEYHPPKRRKHYSCRFVPPSIQYLVRQITLKLLLAFKWN